MYFEWELRDRSYKTSATNGLRTSEQT